MMVSPSPESDELGTSYLSTHDEPLCFPPVVAHPSVQTFVDSRKGPSFGGSVPPEEMGGGSSVGLILPVDAVEGPIADSWGGADFSLLEMKDGDFPSDLGNGLRAGVPVGVGVGVGVVSGVGGVPAEMGVLDEVCGANGRVGVTRGSDEVFLSEMKEKLVLGDLEEGFVEDDGGSQQESEISLLELKKKQLLSDLEHGSMFREVVCTQALGNEDVSEGTLVLDKLCNMDGTKEDARKCTDNSGKMEGSVCSDDGFDLGRSLKIEVIDDTAVVEQVPICEVCSMVQKENEMPSDPKNQKEEKADGKKARRARRKAKSLHRNEEILRKQGDENARFEDSQAGQTLMYSMVELEALRCVNVDDQLRGSGQVAHFQNGQAGCKVMYSRVELEALRYVNVEDQQRLWMQVYDGLGPVAKEYACLLSSRAQPGPVDCLQQSHRRERGPRILSEVNLKQLSVELGNFDLNMNKVVGLSDPSRVPDTVTLKEGDPDLEIVESCVDAEDDDEYYASIQRPAFFVEGEPNFDAGPPEDGLEYLRRVRWEAAHIPDVKVAKLDNRRLNKVQSVYMPEIPEIPDCPPHLLPLKQWEDAFLADFSKLRLALSGIECNSQQISDKLQYLISSSDPDPFTSAELKYEQACPDNVGNIPSLPVKEATSSETSHEMPPRLSVIHVMDSVARVSMLKKRIKKAGAMTSLSRNECLWLFALCAVVDTPLDADTCAALRSLLRKCASLRAEKAEMDDKVAMLNILATVAGKYFGQSG